MKKYEKEEVAIRVTKQNRVTVERERSRSKREGGGRRSGRQQNSCLIQIIKTINYCVNLFCP